MFIEYKTDDSRTVTVKRNKKVLGTISRSRRTFTAARQARLTAEDLAAIELFMASVR
jgi:hypothetical protein